MASTASQPSGTDSTIKSASSRMVSASIRLISMSSTSRMRYSPWARWSSASAPAGASSAAPPANFRGRSTVKTEPWFFLLRTVMDPPIRFSRLLVMDSPSPVPTVPALVELSSRSKASYIRRMKSSVIPTPVSATVNSKRA